MSKEYYIDKTKNNYLQADLINNFPIIKENASLGICALIGDFDPGDFKKTDKLYLDLNTSSRTIKYFSIKTKQDKLCVLGEA